MADTIWFKRVRDGGVLTLDTSGVSAAAWKTAITAAVRELNDLFHHHKIAVQLAEGSGGEVKVGLAVSSYKYTVEGKEKVGTLDAKNLYHGKTHVIEIDNGKGPVGEYGFIFLPTAPRIEKENPKSRLVGEPVMRVIAAHEFVHALGIVEHDNSYQDLMAPQVGINVQPKAADDRTYPYLNSKLHLPPLVLSGSTVSRLKACWPGKASAAVKP